MKGGAGRPNSLHLRRSYGFAGEYKDVVTTTKAAQLRVARFEGIHLGGLNIRRRVEELEAARRNTNFFDCDLRWRQWYEAVHSTVLLANREAMGARGITTTAVENEAAGSDARPWTEATVSKVRRGFQKAARALSRPATPMTPSPGHGENWSGGAARIAEKLCGAFAGSGS